MMNYQETLSYLYESTPLFQNVGKDAYKEGLGNTLLLDEHFNHPHRHYRTIHIAGTNGKGSCSHTIAAMLQSAGYRTGLYTSPHLIDFRERIRVDGIPVTEEFVVRFVENHRAFFEPLHPSFFELTTAMAFHWFALEHVDVAVVEVGLGGRLDCTNIINPDLCLITNISFDHVQFLGNTLEKIAREKAGIIKQGVPVVIGETTSETKPVFASKAAEMKAPIVFAEEEHLLKSFSEETGGGLVYATADYGEFRGELGGLCQEKNTNTLLSAVRQLTACGYKISADDVRKAFANVCSLTGLMGRWQKLESNPDIVCDTGHNVGGMRYIAEQLKRQECRKLHIIIGMVNDKDISGVMSLLPYDARYYFTRATVKRALPSAEVKRRGEAYGLSGEAYPDVAAALAAAKSSATALDFIFVGGSTFIVADLLFLYKQKGYFSSKSLGNLK